jgi:hypothetical protein
MRGIGWIDGQMDLREDLRVGRSVEDLVDMGQVVLVGQLTTMPHQRRIPTSACNRRKRMQN